MKKPFAEIIESSLACWKARSWQWDYAPPFGSLVTLEHKNLCLFGIIHQIELGSSDPSREPYAYQKNEAVLQAEQPQIFEFLRTNIHIVPVGYQEETRVFYQLPPVPPKIHTFVQHADAEQERLFFSDPSYLHTLFGLSNYINHLDELLLTILKNIAYKNISSHTVTQFIDTLSQQSHNDYNRIRLFCARAQQFLGTYHV